MKRYNRSGNGGCPQTLWPHHMVDELLAVSTCALYVTGLDTYRVFSVVFSSLLIAIMEIQRYITQAFPFRIEY